MQRCDDLLLPRVRLADYADARKVRVDHVEEARAEVDAPDRSLFERMLGRFDVRTEGTLARAEHHEDVDAAVPRHLSCDLGGHRQLAVSGLRFCRRVEHGLQRCLRGVAQLRDLVFRLHRLHFLDVMVDADELDVG